MEGRKGRPRKLDAEASAQLELKIAAAVQFYRNQGFALRDKGVTDDDASIIRNAPHRIAETRGRVGACRLVSGVHLNSTVGPDLVEKYYKAHKASVENLTGWELHQLKHGLVKQFNPEVLTYIMADSDVPVPDTPRYRRAMADLQDAIRFGKPREED